VVATALAVVLAWSGGDAVRAQTADTRTGDPDVEVVSAEPVPQRAPSPAGPFAQGRKRLGFFGGAGSTLGQTYAIIGGGFGYFVADGLEVGASFEGWILQDPTIWKLTPEVRYTVWQSPRFQPYVGAFWRRTFVGDPFDDVSSWGGRGGLVYRSGKGYAGVGMVYERFDGDLGEDQDTWYPEFSFALYF
jgi:hypothetical protein